MVKLDSGEEISTQDLLNQGVYVNWIDKLVLVGNKVLPFWLHAYNRKKRKYYDSNDNNTKKFHAALSGLGFCPLCGKEIKKRWF